MPTFKWDLMSWRWWGELYKSGKPKGLIQMRENEQKLLHYFLHSQTSFPSSLAWSFFRDSSTLYSIVMRFQLLQVIEKGNYVCMHGNGKHLGRSKDELSVACDTQIKKAAAVIRRLRYTNQEGCSCPGRHHIVCAWLLPLPQNPSLTCGVVIMLTVTVTTLCSQ